MNLFVWGQKLVRLNVKTIPKIIIEKRGISKSQSKHIKFEEYKKCLDGEDHQQECNN